MTIESFFEEFLPNPVNDPGELDFKEMTTTTHGEQAFVSLNLTVRRPLPMSLLSRPSAAQGGSSGTGAVLEKRSFDCSGHPSSPRHRHNHPRKV